MLILLKFVCLLLGVMYGFSNIVKGANGHAISSAQVILMSLGIVGFVFLQFKLYL